MKHDGAAYLGDGLYVNFDGYQIELYASNGVAKLDVVYLEPMVLERFLEYIQFVKGSKDAETPR